jgi:hypothetical protein
MGKNADHQIKPGTDPGFEFREGVKNAEVSKRGS